MCKNSGLVLPQVVHCVVLKIHLTYFVEDYHCWLQLHLALHQSCIKALIDTLSHCLSFFSQTQRSKKEGYNLGKYIIHFATQAGVVVNVNQVANLPSTPIEYVTQEYIQRIHNKELDYKHPVLPYNLVIQLIMKRLEKSNFNPIFQKQDGYFEGSLVHMVRTICHALKLLIPTKKCTSLTTLAVGPHQVRKKPLLSRLELLTNL